MKFLLLTAAALVGAALYIAAGLVWSAAEDSDEVDLARVFLWPLSAAGFVAFLACIPLIVAFAALEAAVLRVRRWLRSKPAPGPGPDEDLE